MDRPKVQNFKNTKSIKDVLLVTTFSAGHLVEKNASWRTFMPVIDIEKCKGCLRCFLVCPDGVIFKSGEKVAIDYDFCKGCGVCENECKFDAISMVKEEL